MVRERAAVYEMGAAWPVCPAQMSETTVHVPTVTNNECGGNSEVPYGNYLVKLPSFSSPVRTQLSQPCGSSVSDPSSKWISPVVRNPIRCHFPGHHDSVREML